MSCSFSTSLIVGVRLSALAQKKEKENKFEIHDKRGNPTGKWETEKEIFLYVKNKESIKISDKIFIDEIEIESEELEDELIQIYPMDNSNNLDDFVVGKDIFGISPDCNDNLIVLSDHNLELEKEKVQKSLQSEFDYKGKVEIFILSTINC